MQDPIAADGSVLLVVSKRIGDTLFCTRALRWLRTSHPRLRIEVVAPSIASGAVLRHNPNVDRLWVRPGWWTLRHLARRYDCVVDLHGARETRRITGRLRSPFTTLAVHGNEQTALHQTELVASLVRELFPADGGELPATYELFPQAHHAASIERLLRERGCRLDGGEILIGCHPGSYPIAARGRRLIRRPLAAEARNWPFERFVELGDRLAARHPDLRVVLTGSSGEKEVGRRYFRDRPWVIDLIGATDVLELAALLRCLRSFVTGDTGPLHVACAMGTPLVALSGPPQVPARTGPFPPRPDRILLHEERGLGALDVERVLGAVSETMRSARIDEDR